MPRNLQKLETVPETDVKNRGDESSGSFTREDDGDASNSEFSYEPNISPKKTTNFGGRLWQRGGAGVQTLFSQSGLYSQSKAQSEFVSWILGEGGLKRSGT